MKPYVQSVLALLLIAAPLYAQTKQKGASVPPAVIPHKFEAKCIGVIDGDTIRVANEEISVLTIRLEGIDAPEAKQPYGKQATDYVHHLLFKKEVTVEWKEQDKYQRYLGYVYLDGNLVNKTLVEQGYAWQFTKYNKSPALKALEETARGKKLGLWSKDAPIPPWDYRDGKRPFEPGENQPEPTIGALAAMEKEAAKSSATAAEPKAAIQKTVEQSQAKPKTEEVTVYLTKTGTHYHRAGCQHLRKSSIPIPLSRASGYSPCKQCSPPQ